MSGTHTRYTAVVEIGEAGSWVETGYLTVEGALNAAVAYAATTNQRVTDLYVELPHGGVVIHPSPEVLRRVRGRAEERTPCPLDDLAAEVEAWLEEIRPGRTSLAGSAS